MQMHTKPEREHVSTHVRPDEDARLPAGTRAQIINVFQPTCVPMRTHDFREHGERWGGREFQPTCVPMRTHDEQREP